MITVKGKCRYLDGDNVKPNNKKEADALLGMDIVYLPEVDIAKCGRGYFIPRYGTVTGYERRHLIIDSNFHHLGQIREIALAKDTPQ